ncbi:MAG: hypothetical protein JWN03_737 [Nocardia sp.]|uniref:MAB_1171c family putative transporter n=1 Tax=Nocardia sp. TaxID=1821 RepID=UPI00261E1F76|nr:MAB_1171c family putative transporter [Nocardia sp.]MCU1640462.1 hypothetical protein [Nocardia sp.]
MNSQLLPPYSSMPEVLAWPLWILTATVTILRLRWCKDTFAQRRINGALVGSTIAWFLLIATAQQWIVHLLGWPTPARQYQLANALMIVVTAEAYLMISHARQQNPLSQRIVYAAAVAMGLGYLALGSPVAAGGGIVLQYPGWEAAPMTVLFVVFPYACSVLLVAACVQELRARPPLAARFFYLLFMAIFAGLLCSLSFGLSTSFVLATGHVDAFTEYAANTDRMAFVMDIIAFTPFAAIPLVLRAFDAVRGDPVARALDELTPLWQELTAACPDIVQPRPENAGATYQLHRMVIEINDAILSLLPYVPDHEPSAATDLASIAPLLRAARDAKLAADPPNFAARQLEIPGGADLQTETQVLSALAKEWSRCRPSPIPPGAFHS